MAGFARVACLQKWPHKIDFTMPRIDKLNASERTIFLPNRVTMAFGEEIYVYVQWAFYRASSYENIMVWPNKTIRLLPEKSHY